MMSDLRRLACPQCGAPFDEPADRASGTPVRCEFCGTLFEPPEPPEPPEQAADDRPLVIDLRGAVAPATGAAGKLALAIGLFIGFLVLAIVGGTFLVVHKATSMAGSIARQAGSLAHARVAIAPWTRDRLRGLGRVGRVELDVAPPAGALASFEAVANLPWALNLAQGWQSDVRLERIDVDRLRPDGTANLADDPDAEVLYRFLSPSRLQEFERQADLDRHADADYGIWIAVGKGKAWAQLNYGRPSHDETVPPFPQAQPLTRTLPAALQRARGAGVPFWEGYLLYTRNDGWEWYFSSLSHRDSLPRVRASDGALWPWRAR